MRLFSPFPDDQFGGGVYEHEGLYGSIGAGIVSLSQPSDQVVGSTEGGTQYVTNVIPNTTSNATSTTFTYSEQVSQINTSQFHADWETATQFVIGNQVGHHGWEFKGTVVSPQRCDYDGIYGGIVIEDPAVVNVNNYNVYGSSGNYYVWTGNSYQLLDQQGSGSVNQIGRLWMIVGLDSVGSSGTSYNSNTNSGSSTTSQTNRYAFVPMPITYDAYNIMSKVNTWSVEAMYTYRFHPFRSGTLEALGGLRYTEFDGRFNFAGHASTQNESSYNITEVSILNTNTQGSGDNQQTQTSQSYGSYDYNTNASRGADLGYSKWNFQADNHLIGPQVGLRYTVSNNRWRFAGEAKYFAGFNRQNVYGDGTLGLKAMSDSPGSGGNSNNNNNNNNSNNSSTNTSETGGIQTYTPIGVVNNAFAYSKHYDAYSNGVDGSFSATWNWTEAIGFKISYEMLYLDNIARASAINNYRINEDGSIFGVKARKKDRNFDQFVHGVMFTVMVNR
ncbi:MAG: BBP7 family outer membrane beta-barrel protein [Planctomycetia bacterium]|nr:BBP7 family outer membrane beta-barrel protein [Planctomycetia bacterium]